MTMHNAELNCPLTRREILAIQLSADGLSAKRVAHEMAISMSTVNNYLNSARDKLQLINMASLVATALRQGWIQ